MQNLVKRPFFSYSFLFGIFLLAASLPYSKFLMSLAQIILLLSWICEGNLKQKIKLFLNNKIAIVISSLFILHLIGLAYTSDFDYGLEDVKKKIPLLLIPLLFSSSSPLSKKMFENVLVVFVVSVIVATLICFAALLGHTHKEILQPQQASLFISHIRFGLLISLSIFILAYFLNVKSSLSFKIVIPLLITWLVIFLIMMESAMGLLCTAIVSAILFLRLILFTKKINIKILFTALFIIGIGITIKTLHFSAKKLQPDATIENKELPLLTKNGNPYVHDTMNKEIENGNYVWLNVCESELIAEWSKKSTIDYHGTDRSGNTIKYTLIRFLTSKGLTKDAEGIQALSPKEVKAIEKGIPNINFTTVFNPTARIQKIMWEFNTYNRGGNPSGHSVIQRFEFWKAATEIIKENILFGVGTGDVKKAFEKKYEEMNSPLTKEWRLRSHNQFLAIGTAFGTIGILWFLITLFYPIFAEKKLNDYFYLVFFLIAFLSMFTEDTLESQAGITFFSFFNAFFLFLKKEK